MDLIKRHLYYGLKESLKHFPVVAITGPRQCGKSTLIRNIKLGGERFCVSRSGTTVTPSDAG